MKSVILFLLSFVFAVTVSAQERPRKSVLSNLGLNNKRPATTTSADTTPTLSLHSSSSSSSSSSSDEPPAFNWNGASVDIVLQVYGDCAQKTILKDPGVPSSTTITLKSHKGQKLSKKEYLEAIETVLEMNQIHLEPYGTKFIRALPRKGARQEGIPLYLDEAGLREAAEDGTVMENKVVSLMIRFEHLNEEDMQNVANKVLESFKSASGTLLTLSKSRKILVTDTYLNIKRMMEIAKEIDIPQPEEAPPEIECIQIVHANASDIIPVIERIVSDSLKEQEEQKKKGGGSAASSAPASAPTASGGSKLDALKKSDKTDSSDSASQVFNASNAMQGIIKGRVTAIAETKSNKIVLITSAENMCLFRRVISALDVKTRQDVDVKVYRLKYAEAEEVSNMLNDLIGNTASSKDTKGNQNGAAKKGKSVNLTRNTESTPKRPANQRTGDLSAGELNKDNTTVLHDKRINGIVVMTNMELFPTVEKIIESMDVKLDQVLIETAIIEVTLGKNLNTGVDWVQNQATGSDPMTRMGGGGGGNAGVLSAMSSSKTYAEWYAEAKEAIGSDATQTAIESYIEKAKAALNNGSSVSPVGSGLNLLFKSDKLNLSAVITAAKTDSQSKYIASPIVMTVDNKEATINATDMTYLLKGFTSSGNSYSTIAVPDYEQKELGIEIKTTPKINPNGTVMLKVEAKYTQKGAEQTIKYSAGNTTSGSSGLQDVSVPTTSTREMSADVLLENMQTVVLGGLTDTYKSESETGIPILKDIPVIGKWLFGKVVQDETRKELLIFMTPYVMDDGDSAQAEALRRKKVLSTSRPWDDHGWSLSELADPVSKKELLRRVKEEWKLQDEERKNRIALEKEKVDRANKLREMSREERELWIKMHKDELEKEAKEELEKKMLDEDSQEDMKKRIEKIRSDADNEVQAAAKETDQPNERAKLDAAKKEADKAKEETE